MVAMAPEAPSTFVIVNPASAGGSTAAFWPQASSALRNAGIRFDHAFTAHRGHAVELATTAGRSEYQVLLYVGGDGTANEVANGLLQIPAARRPALAALPRGSGGDFPKALGLRRGVEAAIDRLRRGRRTRIDVAHSRFLGFDQQPTERAFINVADAGLGGHVTERVNKSHKPLGGTIAFLEAIVSSFWAYENIPMTIKIDGATVHTGPVATAVVANGSYFGGGVKIAPAATPDDGLLDIVVVGDINKLDLITQLPRIYRGTHVRHPKVSTYRGREIVVDAAKPLPLDLDGEFPGFGPFHVRLEPAALEVIT